MKRIIFSDLLKAISIMVFCAGLVYLMFFAAMKQLQLGLVPGKVIFEFSSTQPVFAMNIYQESIPVTGEIDNQDIIFYDDFSGTKSSFTTINGLLHYTGNEMTLSPRTFVKGTLAMLNINNKELPISFDFSADLLTPWYGNQQSGLALNCDSNLEGLLFLINPNNTTYSIGTWKNNSYTKIIDWKKSDFIHGVMEINQLSVHCRDEKTEFYINGSLVEKTDIQNPCNDGVPGFFIENPAWFVVIDNAMLARN